MSSGCLDRQLFPDNNQKRTISWYQAGGRGCFGVSPPPSGQEKPNAALMNHTWWQELEAETLKSNSDDEQTEAVQISK